MEPFFDRRVRLARPCEIDRIAQVAASGFFHSPTFQYQRPHYADYPGDTLQHYAASYSADIIDPAIVVIVTVDKWISNETDSVYPALQPLLPLRPELDSNGELVVGVCSIDLKAGSQRIGQFQPQDPMTSDVRHPLKRDQDVKAVQQYSNTTGPTKAMHLAGQMRLSTLTVHPFYWGRGHATRLVKWCTNLADTDNDLIGISAVPGGVRIARKAGFVEKKRVHVGAYDLKYGDKQMRRVGSVELWVAIRQPCHPPAGPPN